MTSALPPLHVGGDRQATNLHGRNFLKELDFTADEFLSLIHLSAFLKADKRAGCEVRHLTGKNIALIFEKTSTRTRAPSTASCGKGWPDTTRTVIVPAAVNLTAFESRFRSTWPSRRPSPRTRRGTPCAI